MATIFLNNVELRTGERVRQKGTGRLGTVRAFGVGEIIIVQWDDAMTFDILARDLVRLTVVRFSPSDESKKNKKIPA